MQAVIKVEQTAGPILLISGKEDRVWNSSSMADSMVSRLKQFRFAYNVEQLKYPHAGHAAGRPEIVPAWQGPTRNPTSGRDVEMGGTPRGNAESSLDAIPKVIDFLRESSSASGLSCAPPVYWNVIVATRYQFWPLASSTPQNSKY